MTTLMTLNDLAQELQGVIEKGSSSGEQVLFSGISQDSRFIKSGDVFIVIPGDQAESYTRTAIKAGAVALIAESDFIKSFGPKIDVPIICVASARMALSQSAVFLYPGQPKIMVAVTGTNGKTSVVTFVRQIWEKLGYAAASFGTLGVQVAASVQIKGDLPATKLNTPDALLLHQRLQTLAESNVTHCVFEASSHGLDQYRMHGVKLEVAGFTNFSQDHLDYHATMDDYFEAKARLFLEVLPPGKTAVINVASSYYHALKVLILGRGQSIISYGVDHHADLTAKNVSLKANRIHFDLVTEDQTWTDLSLNMVGSFQLENVLCAIGLVHAAGAPLSLIVQTLTHLQSAPGRMEFVGKTKAGSSVFIDYAHTPDALQRALEALRKHVHQDGRLRVVFGCGGNRDAAKRSQMGEIAQQLADDLYITDDNPRDEDPAFIRQQILVSCPQAHNIGDRRNAIRTAIQQMCPNDVLLIAGKGHERGQIIGDRIVPFDDREEAQTILKEG
jgi:UDP-N-acetylmuramoyl-L-alanyl-D-glutamate--2,6-diaminopimelate ligase